MQPIDVKALFDYLYWRRDIALMRAAELPARAFAAADEIASRDLRSTLVHELDVEWSWRLRLQGAPPETRDDDKTLRSGDYPTADALREHWSRDEAEMRDWLAGLTEAAPAAPAATDRQPLETYLIHVLMHGIQSFSEAGVLLDAAGYSVGDVDYLDYLDTADG